MKIPHTGGNKTAPPYRLPLASAANFDFLRSGQLGLTRRVVEECGAGKIRGISGKGVDVVGRIQEFPHIIVRGSRNRGMFYPILVSEKEFQELQTHFDLNMAILRVIFKRPERGIDSVVPSWQELFSPAFLQLYLNWLKNPAGSEIDGATFPWSVSGGIVTFPHVPGICHSFLLRGKRVVEGTARLGVQEGAPLFTFQWPVRGKRKAGQRSFIYRGGKFSAVNGRSLGQGYEPSFNKVAFVRFFDSNISSSSTLKVAGFLRTGKTVGYLNLGAHKGEQLQVCGTRSNPLQKDTWYWVAARKISPSVIELKVFLNKGGEFLGKAVFHTFEGGGMADARVGINK